MENKKAHIYNLVIVDESGSMSYLKKSYYERHQQHY